ncbi:MAG TPA: hypothetical protein VFE51_03135 [Verrucomicrobiae bacterium]|nr:hypothetical protein [Verrucomicrobiae bacterium]
MKSFGIISLLSLICLASACSTNQGATSTAHDSVAATTVSPVAPPIPPGSPSQRPGMSPEDLRDPQHLTRPEPLTPTP